MQYKRRGVARAIMDGIATEQLRAWYIDERKSTRQVATLIGVSQPWARKLIRDRGIQIRDPLDRDPAVPRGTKFTEEHKRKIGEANKRHNASLTDRSRPWKVRGKFVECAVCGKMAWKTPFDFEHHDSRSCSLKCAAIFRGPSLRGENNPRWARRVVGCAQCGAELVRKRCELIRDKRHFCSQSCSGQWKSENLVGDKVYNWRGGYSDYRGPGWFRQRSLVRERDSYTCQRCGATRQQMGKCPDVHHVKPFREFGVERYLEANDLSNLICLCNVCHKIVEESG